MEIWKDIEGYDGRYQISNHGQVKKTDNGNILGGSDNGAGYLTVGLYCVEKKSTRTWYRHRLVAQAFLPNPNNLPQVGHRDDDKSNNHVDNLYWCTGSRNILDAHKTGRMKKRAELGQGQRHSDESAASAYRAVKMGEMGVAEAARHYGMPRTTLSSIMNKKARWEITDKIDEELENNH